jgi:PKD repeat protein
VGETDSCQANFETVTSASNSHGKYFIAQPWNKNGKKPVFICWNFGDNSDTCIQYSTSFDGHYAAFHSYAHAGNYNVCVKINYDGGCESYYCKAVQMVETDSCEADFEVGLMNSTSLGRHFVALPSNNHDKKPEQICWSFGDGRDTCITYPENYTGTYAIEHRYDLSGIYEACMKISYYGGCQAKKCKKFGIVYDLSPCDVRLFEITPSAVSLIREFYFYSSNTNNPTHVCWNFGDGTDTCIAIEPGTEIPHTIKHTYPAPGAYRACVKIIFLNGCSATDCHEVAIRTLSDMCGGYYTDSLLNINSYVFKGFSVHKPDDAVVDYKWAFGDGTSGTGERVTHSYPDAGTYRVCLSINTEKGCETKICNDVKIAGNSQSALTLTPNPVSNILHATFISANNETVTIKISNSYGVAVKTYTRSAVVGSNTWDFENGDLLPGVYLFSVQSTNQFASNIFFKL